MHKFGLVGKDISYSFSRNYFSEKFSRLQLSDHSYVNFDLSDISELESLLQSPGELQGLNVTIPYKEAVLPLLTTIDPEAAKVGAVNTIKFTPGGTTGYNTDIYGFETSLLPYLEPSHKKALILGTGGASKAVAYVLERQGISYTFVSRNPLGSQYHYEDLNSRIIAENTLLVNCTPLGTFPDTKRKPDIPYDGIGAGHLLYDLIYNPPLTAFLAEGQSRGATTMNGHEMLKQQAEKSWQIWNS
ncbi:shikimate dehydrogenase family protein [Zeaxanthinibacter enoshimensis]|uniref:Shikimate dehydrogenase n=1 Tax=Zeaxanthinibacter enoshimensis TaxID=392009 RepID=A0A4R6TJB1_9FLAO|nr:shikimate dehydrogenase [Zeaxanthinibacter enoshimensis]TDQ29309.1 shikimate dehydrogenase [Zeaxanthinibacter enoshimensis]